MLKNPVVLDSLDAVEPAVREVLADHDFRTSREVKDLVDIAKSTPQLSKYV